jgi:hypothetical protein
MKDPCIKRSRSNNPVLDVTGYIIECTVAGGARYVSHEYCIATLAFKADRLSEYTDCFLATEPALALMRNRYAEIYGSK